jgi:undecaprenyl-diphosphatase
VDLLQAVVLALVQGLTEFLPISSSAHLILVPRFLGWPDQGLAFDVAVHIGTLLAVLWYFRLEVHDILLAWSGSVLRRDHDTANARLGWGLLLGTLPLLIGGFLLEDVVKTMLRTPMIIAAATAFFGILLWVADRRPDRVGTETAVTIPMALLVGLSQLLALIPGTSRSGVTMTTGLALGLDRETAARFSFLLSIPAIAGAGALETARLLATHEPVPWMLLATGIVVSAASAWLCIRLFLAAIQRIGMLPFVFYRLALAGIIFFSFR